MLRNIVVNEDERVIAIKDGRVEEILMPGRHRYFDLTNRYSFEGYKLSGRYLTGTRAEGLMRDHKEFVEEHFFCVDNDDRTVTLVLRNGKFFDLVDVSETRLYWKGDRYEARSFDVVEEMAVPEEFQGTLLDQFGSSKALFVCAVPFGHAGILAVNGCVERELAPGRYAFWTAGRRMVITQVDLRLRQLEVSGQEILTKDKVSVRLNVTCEFRVTDALAAVTEVKDYAEYIYKSAQFAIREVVGTQTLDELLEQKDEINTVLNTAISGKLGEVGVALIKVGVKDIILPGDMREILNRVVEAEKSAAANVIRRREETAATRSLLNTAKMMEDNPILLRMKELEATEKLVEKIDSLNVYQGLDGVLKGLVNLKGD